MSQESHSEMKKSLTRRDFILKAGSALAGMSLVPGLLKPDPAHPNISSSLPTRKIRIGVVGGGFGSDFYWHEHPNCIVQAVSDLRGDRRKRLMDIYKCSNLTHEFIDALVNKRKPAIDIYEALAFTVPGIVAHKSALEGGAPMKIPSFD